MTFIEFIGFIVTMLALFFILLRKAWEDRKRRQNPEQYEQEEVDREKALREFLRSLDVEVEEAEPFREPPTPPPTMPQPPSEEPQRIQRLVRDAYELPKRVGKYEITEGVESRIYETEIGNTEFRELGEDIVTEDLFLESESGLWGVIGKKGKPRIQKILKDMKRPGNIVIYREILGQPKALQKHILPHDLCE